MMRLAAGVAAAKAVGTLARTAGRGGGTSLPGKVLTRVEPHAIGRLARRLDRGSVVISATNGKTTTAAMVASILERTGARLVHNRAGANMAGGIASALADASRRGGRALTGDFGLFEVDEFWLGPVVEELEPRAMLLGNLFRDQLDRYGELETIADRWAAVVAARPARRRSCSTPTTRWSPTSAASRAGAARRTGAPWPEAGSRPASSTSASTTTRSRCPSSSTPATPSTAAAAATPTPTPPSTSPTSATTRARTAARSARSPTVVATRRRAARHPHRRLHAARPPRSSSRSPASTTSTTRSAPPRSRSRWASSSTTSSAGLQAVAPAFGRAETLDLGGRPAEPAAGQEPGRRQRGAADARARGRRARPARRAQRPHRRRPRRQLGLGRRLGAAGRPACGGSRPRARAPPSSRCG